MESNLSSTRPKLYRVGTTYIDQSEFLESDVVVGYNMSDAIIQAGKLFELSHDKTFMAEQLLWSYNVRIF
jgi:hypothetical protein